MHIYIPDFWCGFILGAIVATVAIIGLAICSGKSSKKKNIEESEGKEN